MKIKTSSTGQRHKARSKLLDATLYRLTYCAMNTLISARGQTVVPSEIRRKYGLGANSRLAWIDDGTSVRVVPLGSATGKYGRGIAKGMGLGEALLASRREERARERRPRTA